MKLRSLLLLALLVTLPAVADEGIFPGLRATLTAAEWKRAGLDQLSPDQIGVIDAAIIRHYLRAVTGVGPLPTPEQLTAQQRAERAAAAAANPAPSGGILSYFGFGQQGPAAPDWREQPPMIARCTGWQGGNRFALDNGQVWDGIENIPFEIAGKQVIIEARPMGNYALKLDDKSPTARVRRLK